SQIVTYYPYGEIRTNDLKNNNPIDLPHKFTGQEYDNERGLYYFVARYYDPAAGRFITPDTIVQSPGDPQTLNRYAYARNNPLLYTDPSGRLFLIDDIIIGAIIGAAIGATSSAISGGDIGMSALTGAIGGAFFGAAGGIIENSIASAAQAAGISYQAAVQAGMGISTAGQVGLHAAAGIASGGINAAITGGDVGLGMLTGGLSGGIGKYAGGFIPNN
ncbi:MAG: RHS repeat-associated core domain-containing protein, partial [Bacillota bacterium]